MTKINRLLNPPFATNERDNYYDSLSNRLSSYIDYLHDSALLFKFKKGHYKVALC